MISNVSKLSPASRPATAMAVKDTMAPIIQTAASPGRLVSVMIAARCGGRGSSPGIRLQRHWTGPKG